MEINERVTGRSKLLGLLGNPVGHSISPQLHNTLSDLLGIDAVYVACRADRERLGMAVKGLQACNFLGFNITVPYKEEVVAYCDELSEDVVLSGAANTVKNKNGRLFAWNTDGTGFIRALKLQTGQTVKDRKVVILGAGGTARSLAVRIAREGAGEIAVVNRTVGKAQAVADIVNRGVKKIVTYFSYEGAEQEGIFEGADLIVNTTSVGLHPDVDACPLRETIRFKSRQTVYDVIYKPAKTILLQRAEKVGCITANGLGMLICQGVEAYEIWMEQKVPEEIVLRVFDAFSNYLAE